MDTDFPPAGLRMAPHVGFTRLPFGGGVLIDHRTLAVAECDEYDAERISQVLAGVDAEDVPDPAGNRLVAQLLESGWMVTAPDRK